MNIFLCLVPFNYFVYKSLYKNLEKSYFAIPPLRDRLLTDEFGGGLSKKGQYNYIEGFLKRKNVEIIDYGEKTAEKLAEFLDANCDNVIAPHWFAGINHIHNTRIIRMMYGLANKESSTYSIENNFLMDLILTYGDNSAERFLTMGLQAEPVGNPIFDDWFTDNIDGDDLESIKRKLDDKPTVLYLPTFNKYSCIEIFIDDIVSLSCDYNIIVKLHHCTFIGESNRLVDLLSRPEIVVLGDYVDPQVVYKLADLVLVENSGAIYDAILLDKPVIILGASLVNHGYDIYDERNINNVVKKSEIVPSTNNPKELESLVTDNIGKKPYLNNGLRRSLFFKTDGCAGKRATEAILNYRKYPTIPTLEKYEKAIENAPDKETRDYIINKRNCSIKKYHRVAIEKPNILQRVLKRLSFG
jgi:CDP-glycerol glycerophosphotransferase (TagB/SpsB family)